MKYISYAFLMLMLITGSSTQASATGTAEASTGSNHSYMEKYDLSGLSEDEMRWFTTFLEGTFFAEGWREISSDILVKIAPEERDQNQYVLTRLGNRIGREWCKKNTVRKIDTSMLKKWGDILRDTAKNEPELLAEVLENINGELDLILD